MSNQEKLEIYTQLRQIRHRYKLDQMESGYLGQILPMVDQAKAEIRNELENRFDVGRWEDRRNAQLLAELERLSQGVKEQVGGQVEESSAKALEKSAEAQSSIYTLEGRAANVAMLQLSQEQIRSFVDTPVGGRTLQEWVSRSFDQPLIDKLKEEMGTGVFRGESYRKLADRIDELMDEARGNVETLTRSWVQDANVRAQKQMLDNNRDIVRGWRWNAILENSSYTKGHGTCLRCMALDADDTVYPLDGGPPMPLHPNCFPAETPVFAPDKLAATIATYDGPVLEIGFSNGARFTVTPNHMFLTDRGMVPAHALSKCDNVFYSAGADGDMSGVPDNNGGPAPIEKEVEALAKTRSVTTRSMPVSPEQFHGDGESIKGNVDVIAPASLLRGDMEALLDEFGDEYPFIASQVASPKALIGEGGLLSSLWWLALATSSGMGGRSVSDVLRPGSFGHHQFISKSVFSSGDPVSFQAFLNDVSGNIEGFGKDVFGFPGDVSRANISLREIVFGLFVCTRTVSRASDLNVQTVPLQDSHDGLGVIAQLLRNFRNRFSSSVKLTNPSFIRERHFCGHVYDLQTFSSMYHADGIIASNCRCVRDMVTQNWEDLGVSHEGLDEAVNSLREDRPFSTRGTVDPITGEFKRGKVGVGGVPLIEAGTLKGGYSEFFQRMPEKMQRMSLGPQRFQMLREGKIRLSDLADSNGRQRTIRELKELAR